MSTETSAWRTLCRVDDIPDGGAKEFPPDAGSFAGLFAVRRGGAVVVYENSCPHIGVPLNWAPDRFLDAKAAHIMCGTHGALFRIDDGLCLKGPCIGESLTAIACRIEDGAVLVAVEAQ